MKRQLINAHNQGIMREAFTAIVPNRARKTTIKSIPFCTLFYDLPTTCAKDSHILNLTKYTKYG